MKKPLIINTLSILVSLLFPLTALLGMMAGQIGSRLFSSLFSSSVGYMGGEFIFFTISGYCAGYFSAFVISKVYKNFNFKEEGDFWVFDTEQETKKVEHIKVIKDE